MPVASQERNMKPLSPESLAEVIKLLREIRKWSQETLADLSGLNIRTIQRIEGAEPSSADSRRALARAFELDDLDHFNKLHPVYSEEELAAERQKIEDKYLTLPAVTITSGRQLGEIAAQMTADCFTQEIELPDDAASELASLIDYLRDFRDCASESSEVSKLSMYADFQAHIEVLANAGFSLCCATRKTALMNDAWPSKKPFPVTVVYFAPFKKGDERTEFIVEKRLNFPL